MTNILRDVGEDIRNGRIYLPLDELLAYNISEADLAAGKIDENWREFMKFQINRTRQLYDQANEGIKFLEKDGRLAIGAASNFYQAILQSIETNDYDVFSRRASLNAWEKLKRIPGMWIRMIGK